ncbi:scoloptoxin SSD14-like [Amblyomma americanum]
METTPKSSQESKKEAPSSANPSAEGNSSDVPAAPACGESKNVALLCVLAVMTTVAVTAGVLLLSGGLENEKKVVEKKTIVISYTPSISTLGNYSEWAATVDAAPCVGASRYVYSKGGDAFDAAVTTLLCNGLVIPESMGLGGGFVATIYQADKKEVKTLIASGTAPSKAKGNMLVPNPDPEEPLPGGLFVAVPGELRGYKALVRKATGGSYDHFNFAIWLAETGFPVGASLADATQEQLDNILDNDYWDMQELYFNYSEEPLRQGDLFTNKDLLNIFKHMRRRGFSGSNDDFYDGDIAQKIVKAVGNKSGSLTIDDLSNYTVRWADPVVRKFRDGRTMYSVPPPANGALLAYILGIMDFLREKASDQLDDSLLTYHRFVEALKFAYGKQALLGDQKFEDSVAQVVQELISEEAAETARSKINDSQTHDDLSYYGFVDTKKPQGGTSHSCFWDAKGNIVAISSTINHRFGSLLIPERAGFPLNNAMVDFATPWKANVSGFRSSSANFIKPNKIPQSSMAPTIVLDKDGNPEMCVGGSGGSRIAAGVGLVAMRALWQGKSIKEAIDQARLHHELMPTELEVEASFPKEYISMLKKKGHKIKVQEVMPNAVSAIFMRDGRLYANSDFRRGGSVDGE